MLNYYFLDKLRQEELNMIFTDKLNHATGGLWRRRRAAIRVNSPHRYSESPKLFFIHISGVRFHYLFECVFLLTDSQEERRNNQRDEKVCSQVEMIAAFLYKRQEKIKKIINDDEDHGIKNVLAQTFQFQIFQWEHLFQDICSGSYILYHICRRKTMDAIDFIPQPMTGRGWKD